MSESLCKSCNSGMLIRMRGKTEARSTMKYESFKCLKLSKTSAFHSMVIFPGSILPYDKEGYPLVADCTQHVKKND